MHYGLSNLADSELSEIIEYSLKYPTRVKALLGAILEYVGISSDLLKTLKDNINPFTKITIGILRESLPTAQKWNIGN